MPPPPRPAFLDENIATDGVTTCDMCSWAWQEDSGSGSGGGGKYSGRGSGYGLSAVDASGELSWVFTLVIVSLISAVIGAIVMIIVLHCKRIKTSGLNESEHNTTTSTNLPLSRMQRPPMDLPPADNKPITRPNSYVHHHLHHHRHQPQLHMARSAYGLAPPHSFDMIPGGMESPVDHSHHLHHHNHHSGVWQWLTRRCSSGSIGGVCGNHLLDGRGISPTAAENHYTHMDETYNIQNGGGLPASNLSIITTASQHDQSTSGEALYAELDSTNGDIPTNPCALHHQQHLTNSSPPPPPPPFPAVQNNNNNIQSYQNSAYTDHPASASTSTNTPPSSAYYSDLSVNGNTERSGGSGGERAVYEVVGANTWADDKRAGSLRLASISEAIGGGGNVTVTTVPSDYV